MNTSRLYIVATPIGNMQDMTFRAVDVLRSVDVIACEDTRETKKLLDEFDNASVFAGELISYHAQSNEGREDYILQLLADGKTVALVSDRGTPGISDPGSRLIARAVEAGVTVVPIPGASALIAALQASGASTHRFYYHGFLPHKKGRQTLLQSVIADSECTHIFYESPHRILKCLEQLGEFGIGERRVIVARELTKQYEEFLRGTAAEILAELQGRPKIQGEFVVIIDQNR